jgi:hypothetical protein
MKIYKFCKGNSMELERSKEAVLLSMMTGEIRKLL